MNPAPAVADDVSRIREGLLAQVADLLKIDPRTIDHDEPLESYGVDSVTAMDLAGELETWLDVTIPDAVLHGELTVTALSTRLAELVQAGR